MPVPLVCRVRGGMLGLVACAALAGCTGSGGSSSSTAPPAAVATPTHDGTPLEDLDTRSLVVRRAAFCDAVDPGAVARALDVSADEVPAVAAYDNGQRTRLTPTVDDVAHEYGCTWKRGGSVAKAWVFAPPVTRQRALTLFKLARDVAGCQEIAGAAAFGEPTIARSCQVSHDIETSFRGLFGDAWMTCSLTIPGPERSGFIDRAGRWCAAVVTAASPPVG